jgi:glutathionylspermidine synthase
VQLLEDTWDIILGDLTIIHQIRDTTGIRVPTTEYEIQQVLISQIPCAENLPVPQEALDHQVHLELKLHDHHLAAVDMVEAVVHQGLMVDKQLVRAPKISQDRLRDMGLEWFYGTSEWDYLSDDLLVLSEDQVVAYQEASEECLDLISRATKHVIEQSKYAELGFNSRVAKLVEYSWNHKGHLHFLGRLDFAGGLEGGGIKLLEYNGDTCSMMPESSALQFEQKMASGFAGNGQFNHIYQDIVKRFTELLDANPDKHPSLLLSHMGHPEDRLNIDFLYAAANDAGFEVVDISAIEQVVFSPDDGIFLEKDSGYVKYDFWYKMLPWEYTVNQEPELYDLLEQIIMNDLAIVVNPPYSMIYQSKGLLKLLYDLYPDSPYLLPTYSNPVRLRGRAFVEKPYFGLEGENIRIFDRNNEELESNTGDFGHNPMVYQEYVPLNKDSNENIYQAGVFHASTTNGLSFRRIDGLIIDEDAEFVGHVIE